MKFTVTTLVLALAAATPAFAGGYTAPVASATVDCARDANNECIVVGAGSSFGSLGTLVVVGGLVLLLAGLSSTSSTSTTTAD